MRYALIRLFLRLPRTAEAAAATFGIYNRA